MTLDTSLDATLTVSTVPVGLVINVTGKRSDGTALCKATINLDVTIMDSCPSSTTIDPMNVELKNDDQTIVALPSYLTTPNSITHSIAETTNPSKAITWAVVTQDAGVSSIVIKTYENSSL